MPILLITHMSGKVQTFIGYKTDWYEASLFLRREMVRICGPKNYEESIYSCSGDFLHRTGKGKDGHIHEMRVQLLQEIIK